MTCSKTPYNLPLPPSSPSCVSRFQVSSQQQPGAQTFRNTTPSLASTARRHRGWAGSPAGQDRRRGERGIPEARTRAAGGTGGPRAGGSPAGHRDLHLGGRDAARQGVELAQRRHVLGLLHCPLCTPRPAPPQISQSLRASRFSGAAETPGSPQLRSRSRSPGWRQREEKRERRGGVRSETGKGAEGAGAADPGGVRAPRQRGWGHSGEG